MLNKNRIIYLLLIIICCLGLSSLSETANADTVGYYIYNNVGKSVTSIVSGSGNIVNDYSYDSFGETHPKLENTANSYKYNGEYYDSEAGLIFLRNRYYDVQTGRFTTKDAFSGLIVEPQGLNSYVYASNNPVNLIDPLGLWYLDFGYTGNVPIVTKLKPSVNVGVKVGSKGIYLYFGSGYGAGGGFTATFSPANPSNGTNVNGTVRGGVLVAGIPVGFKLTGNIGPKGLSGDINMGVGIGTGVSVGAIATQGWTWSQIGNGIQDFFSSFFGTKSNTGTDYISSSNGDSHFAILRNDWGVGPDWPDGGGGGGGFGSGGSNGWGGGGNLFDLGSDIYASPAIFGGNYGGVSLSKTASLLTDLTELKGAFYDDKTGQVILVGKENLSLPQMRLDDLAVAVNSVYSGADPGVSIDPPLVDNNYSVRYDGQTSNTEFGWIMFEADRRMKTLSLGKVVSIVKWLKDNQIPIDPGRRRIALFYTLLLMLYYIRKGKLWGVNLLIGLRQDRSAPPN